VIEILDTGTGIAPENLERIFEPFFTTKPAGRGTGLGLANVKQLVDGLGGTIQVKSRLGEGSSFEIRIPTTESEIAEVPAEPSVPSTRTGTVLVVDDDIRVRAVAVTALERAGHHVLEAANPAAALAAVHGHRGTVDLVLTDVVMAGGGGAEVIRSIRAVVPNIRVLVISGYTDDEALRRGIVQGEFSFIAKPFTADALARAVASALSS
jgi:CheY-like chemotaxis protein